jgi:hypothetical protein
MLELQLTQSSLTGALTLHVVFLVYVNWSSNITCGGPCLCSLEF